MSVFELLGGDVMRGIGVRHRLLCAAAALLLFAACILPVFGTDTDYADGQVLFAARYGDYNSIRDTGLQFGTSSWQGASADLTEDRLCIRSSSDQKTYLLLPEEIPHTATYTILFEFRFSEVMETRGYCGFLLSSSGDAPSNRTELLLRADGTCDGAGQFGEAITAALAGGEYVRVEIPVRHGMMTEITTSVGENRETLELGNARIIPDGRRGFVLRNASCDIRMVKIVCGVDYESETGFYADNSYIAPPAEGEGPLSPPTGDGWWLPMVPVILCGAILWRKQRRCA